MPKNVFVLALDAKNHERLKRLPTASGFAIQELLEYDVVKGGSEFRVDEVLEKARQRLDSFDGPIDGIVGFWDFPVPLLVPMLCREYGLPGVPPEAAFKCAHKYWCRLEQADVLDEGYPEFDEVDPFDDRALEHLKIDFPFWMKPVKAYLAQLGFRVENAEDFERSIAVVRRKIGRFAKPFNRLLEHVELENRVADVDGWHCIAEKLIGGRQCTLEGYGFDGRIEVYGIVDSFTYPGTSVFHRLQYPSQLPEHVQRRMIDETRTLMSHVGYDGGPFNIEFYWEEEPDRLWILEINPRISQSHCYQFEMVDGCSNHQVVLDLATGREPRMPRGEGAYEYAAKFNLRVFEDGVVKALPTREQIDEVHRRFPDSHVTITVDEGDRLSELHDQDSYSYLLAEIELGGAGEAELLERFEECREILEYRIE